MADLIAEPCPKHEGQRCPAPCHGAHRCIWDFHAQANDPNATHDSDAPQTALMLTQQEWVDLSHTAYPLPVRRRAIVLRRNRRPDAPTLRVG